MAKRKFSHWLQSFVEYASYGEAPLNFYFWTGVSTIAGALRRRVYIEQKYFQWLPNFYIVLVAPPGIISKSTTASIGMNLLRKIPGIKFGPDVVTWQALVQSLGNSTEAVMMPDGFYHPMSAITIESSEFGTLLNPSDREMVDVLVSLWDGKRGSFKKETKTSGNDTIENPWVNIIACTTPAWISGTFPEYMIGGGFTSRCIFIYGEQKRQYIAYPGQNTPDTFQKMQDDLIHDLEIISNMAGIYELHPDTILWGEKWYEEHYKSRPAELDNDRFSGYIARKQTHIHKLAIILAAAQRDELVILQSDLEQANGLVTALEAMMPKVFEHIGKNEGSKHADELVQYVRARREVTYSELFRKMNRMFRDQRDFDNCLNSAIAQERLDKVVTATGFLIRVK